MNAVVLHLGHYTNILLPPESHRFFGAGFLFLGVLLVVEVLAGNIWFRSRIRGAIWPVMAMGMGEGLIIVAFLDPKDNAIHFTVGALVLIAGWLELRYRSGQITTFAVNAFVVPALLAGGFEMGVVHGRGDALTAYGHIAMGLTAAMMAGARILESRDPMSIGRRMLMGVFVIALASILLFLQP
jgi:hypothetical protein